MVDRVAQARELLGEHTLDALLISNEHNRRYLSGFTGSAGFLLLTPAHQLLISDGRYQTQAQREAPDWHFRLIGNPKVTINDILRSELPVSAVRRLGFEASDLSVTAYNAMAAALGDGVELVPTTGLIEGLRQCKDADEITLLRRAITLTDEVFARIRPLLRPEMSEQDVAWEIQLAMHAVGSEGLSFSTIVAAGTNSALPHAQPGTDLLGVGRPIVMDFGALYRGYHGDMTRTVILGAADDQFTRIYNHVLDAHRNAAAAVRPGMSGHAADALARDHLRSVGLDQAFSHSLGHGVGLEIHEAPSLRRDIDAPLPAGAVVSIEPGVYLPEWGGVRIEDLVFVEDGGCEIVSRLPKQIETVG
ncbi:MAG: aminopeptidase P family protein [Herpetosiphon sp.]